MAPLKLNTLGDVLDPDMSANSQYALCHWQPFSQAVIAALKQNTVGIILEREISARMWSEHCHCRACEQQLMTSRCTRWSLTVGIAATNRTAACQSFFLAAALAAAATAGCEVRDAIVALRKRPSQPGGTARL